jgi:hypothetical protein
VAGYAVARTLPLPETVQQWGRPTKATLSGQRGARPTGLSYGPFPYEDTRAAERVWRLGFSTGRMLEVTSRRGEESGAHKVSSVRPAWRSRPLVAGVIGARLAFPFCEDLLCSTSERMLVLPMLSRRHRWCYNPKGAARAPVYRHRGSQTWRHSALLIDNVPHLLS